MFVLILNHARYPANPRLIPRARAQASHGNITVLSLLTWKTFFSLLKILDLYIFYVSYM